MRFFLTLLTGALVAGCAVSVRTSDPSPTPAATPEPAPVRIERPVPGALVPPPAFRQAVEAGTRTPEGRPGPRYWQQQARYTLTARLFPAERRLEGTATIVYTNNAPDTLAVLRLELAQNLHAEGALRLTPEEVTGGLQLLRVAADGRALETDVEARPGYLVQGTQLLVAPHTPVAPGGTVTLDLAWQFTIPQAGASGRMGYSEDNLFFLAYWYPQMAVYDDVHGWFTDTFLGNAEFYHGFADYDLTVEAPAGWIVSATGALQNPDEVLAPAVAARLREAVASDTPVTVAGTEDFGSATAAGTEGRLRWHFTAEQVPDVAFSATRESVWEAARTPIGDRDGDGVTDYAVLHSFFRTDAPRWQQMTRYQQHALTYQSAFTALPYPWPHMTAVEGGGIIGGGMEYPMMTLMGDYNANGDSALYYVTAHELAHMWIPMIVSTNERRYSWIDEGATSFLENQARKDFFPGPNHDAPDREDYLTAARAEAEGPMLRWSDYQYPGFGFVIASYRKPATVLVALRGLLGEDTFMRAYRRFISDWAYKHPYPYDFFNTFETVSGQDLDWFWTSWYEETWVLDQAIASVETRGDEAEIVVEDRGTVPMPVRLVVTYADGTTAALEIPVARWLEGRRRASATFRPAGRIARVEIDPDEHFPDLDRGNNVWKR